MLIRIGEYNVDASRVFMVHAAEDEAHVIVHVDPCGPVTIHTHGDIDAEAEVDRITSLVNAAVADDKVGPVSNYSFQQDVRPLALRFPEAHAGVSEVFKENIARMSPQAAPADELLTGKQWTTSDLDNLVRDVYNANGGTCSGFALVRAIAPRIGIEVVD